MSIHDDLCDLCGAYVDPIGGDLALASFTTLRLWCGTCHLDNRKYTLHWIYDAKADYPVREEETTTLMTAPIHRPS